MSFKISVITINLNNQEGLTRTISSVIQQDYANLEYLVIDGDSSDGSKELIEEFAEKITYRVSEKDTGVYSAMNKGIKNSTGDYLIFLNSGDYFSGSDSISKLISNSQGEDLVYGNLLVQESEKTWLKKYPESLNFRYFYFESLPHPACLISKKLFEKVGLYDTSLKIASDWKFFLISVVKYNCSYKYVDQLISIFIYDGISSKKENVEILEYERRTTLKKYFNLYFLFYSLYLKGLNKDIYNKI
ncbi:MAG: glycosyltransferase family 2 protein [Algoriphagus sp.]|nr:glycosyltransferase family 2 protein [Algoriphagus sp.]